MGCIQFEKYLREQDCRAAVVPEWLQQHLVECSECKNYYRFVSTLTMQKGSLLPAPEDLLPAIEKRIRCGIRSTNKEPWFPLRPLFKPALAGFFAVLVAVVSYTCLAHKNVGYVENLSKRFKIARFENIKSGDMLYTRDSTTAAIRLKSDNRLQIHQNTIVRVDGLRHLSLSRGALSLQAEDHILTITTPDGLLTARNTVARIGTVARQENGAVKTETVCMVFGGQLSIASSSETTVLHRGQKAVIAENGRIIRRQRLTAAESALEKGIAAKHTIFAAVGSLCDCIFAVTGDSGKKNDHHQLFGKDVTENRFKVRVFWQEKGLKGVVSGALDKNKKTCSITTRRVHA